MAKTKKFKASAPDTDKPAVAASSQPKDFDGEKVHGAGGVGKKSRAFNKRMKKAQNVEHEVAEQSSFPKQSWKKLALSDDDIFALSGEGFVSLSTLDDYEVLYENGKPRLVKGGEDEHDSDADDLGNEGEQEEPAGSGVEPAEEQQEEVADSEHIEQPSHSGETEEQDGEQVPALVPVEAAAHGESEEAGEQTKKKKKNKNKKKLEKRKAAEIESEPAAEDGAQAAPQDDSGEQQQVDVVGEEEGAAGIEGGNTGESDNKGEGEDEEAGEGETAAAAAAASSSPAGPDAALLQAHAEELALAREETAAEAQSKIDACQRQIEQLQRDLQAKTNAHEKSSSEATAHRKAAEESGAEKKKLLARVASLEEEIASEKKTLQSRVAALEKESAQTNEEHQKTLQLYRYYLALAAKGALPADVVQAVLSTVGSHSA
eukprot:m.135364 g.135364  ORF g.135364 m.135364 type:complete len:431 (+) comp14868_c3_seq1:1476-2768(+)